MVALTVQYLFKKMFNNNYFQAFTKLAYIQCFGSNCVCCKTPQYAAIFTLIVFDCLQYNKEKAKACFVLFKTALFY